MNAISSTASDQFWEPGRTLTLAAARRHTQFIKIIRVIFLAAAAVLVALMLYFMISGASSSEDAVIVDTETVRMTNPRYTGLDGDGEPYNLTAEYALRAIDNPDAVRLINPVMQFLREQGALQSNIIAKEGLYDSKAQTLELRRDVIVKTDDGYYCETTHARIHTIDKTVEGDESIECTGNFGNIKGDRYQIIDNYARFIFLDNVKALLLAEDETALRLNPINPLSEDTP